MVPEWFLRHLNVQPLEKSKIPSSPGKVWTKWIFETHTIGTCIRDKVIGKDCGRQRDKQQDVAHSAYWYVHWRLFLDANHQLLEIASTKHWRDGRKDSEMWQSADCFPKRNLSFLVTETWKCDVLGKNNNNNNKKATIDLSLACWKVSPWDDILATSGGIGLFEGRILKRQGIKLFCAFPFLRLPDGDHMVPTPAAILGHEVTLRSL